MVTLGGETKRSRTVSSSLKRDQGNNKIINKANVVHI